MIIVFVINVPSPSMRTVESRGLASCRRYPQGKRGRGIIVRAALLRGGDRCCDDQLDKWNNVKSC